MSKASIQYVCPTCDTYFNTEAEALECVEQDPPTLATATFSVGEMVYLVARYANDISRPFVKRVVTDVFAWQHHIGYALDNEVEISKSLYVGQRCSYSEFNVRPALTEELHRLGENVPVWNNYEWDKGYIVSADTIDEKG